MPAFTPPPLPSDDKRWKIVNGTMRKNGFARHALIETLHTVQSSFGYLDDDSIRFVARSLRVPLSQAYGVVTFYHYFSLKPPGKHTMTICTGTACYIKGTDKLLAAAEKRLGIPQGQTTKDGQISLMTARCVGACGRAPVVLTDGELHGPDECRADAGATGKVGRGMTIEELEQIAESVRPENAKFDYEINVCMGPACLSQHSDKLKDALAAAVAAQVRTLSSAAPDAWDRALPGRWCLWIPKRPSTSMSRRQMQTQLSTSLGGEPIAELQCDLRRTLRSASACGA